MVTMVTRLSGPQGGKSGGGDEKRRSVSCDKTIDIKPGMQFGFFRPREDH